MWWIVQDVRTCLIRHTKGPGGMCRIVQDVRTCTIPSHSKGPEECVGLYRMSDILYNPTHSSGPLVCRIRQDVRHPVLIRHIPRVQGNVSDCTGCLNLSNPTHQGTRGMCRIVQDVRTCLIRHTKGPEECVRLYRMSEPVQSDTFPGPLECDGKVQVQNPVLIWHIPLVPWNVSDCTGCQNLSNPSHQGTRCVGLYRMSEPVQSVTPRDQRNVSDCTGCQNLSNPTHQGTLGVSDWQDVWTCTNPTHSRDQVSWNVSDCTGCQNLYNPITPRDQGMCRIVQDVWYLYNHTKGPGECVVIVQDVWILSNPTHQGTRGMCRIVQDVRTCLIRHTKGPEECVGLYRMSEPV